MPRDLDSASQTVCGSLNNPQTRPLIVIVDALNQVKQTKYIIQSFTIQPQPHGVETFLPYLFTCLVKMLHPSATGNEVLSPLTFGQDYQLFGQDLHFYPWMF